jgi:hypothetical protein
MRIMACCAFLTTIAYFHAFLQFRSLWRDEAHALALASAPWPEFVRLFAFVEHQTAYLVALRIWTWLAGNSAYAASSFSLVCVLGAAMILRQLVERMSPGRHAGTTAAVLLLLSPVILTYNACVVRPYAFALLTNLIAAAAAVRLHQHFTLRRLLWLGLALLFSVNTQPVNLAFGGALVAGLTVSAMQHHVGRQRWTGVARSALAGLVLVAVAMPVLTQSLRFSHYMADVEPHRPPGALSVQEWIRFGLTSLDAVFPLTRPALDFALADDPGGVARTGMTSWPVWVMLLVCCAAALAWFRRSLWRWLLGWSGLCAGLSLLSSLLLFAASIYHERMTETLRSFSALAPLLAALLALALSRTNHLRIVVILMLAARAAAILPGFAAANPGRMGDARDAVAWMQPQLRPDDLIILANPQLSPAFSYYFRGANRQIHHPYSHEIRYWDMVDLSRISGDSLRIRDTASAIEAAADHGHRVWFVTSGSPAPEPTRYWYCPNALPVLETVLASRFDAVARSSAQSPLEPMNVTLFSPTVR